MKTIQTMRAAAAATLFALPLWAHAESFAVTTPGAGPATGPLVAPTHVDFQVNIQQSLFLQVGTGTAGATNTAVNLVTFNVTAANNGAGAAAVTAAGGDVGTGQVTARLQGNGGAITFSSTTTGDLSDGNGHTIPYGQIKTTSGATVATGATGILPPPALASAGATGTTTTTTVSAAANGVVNLGSTWTYAFQNASVYPAGAYGGVATNNGRVTYTASMP